MKRSVFLVGLLALMFLSQAALLCSDECKLLLSIMSKPGPYLDNEYVEEVLDELQSHHSGQNDGWGLAYYLRNESCTGEGLEWWPQDPDNPVPSNRWAGYANAYNNDNYEMAADAIIAERNRIIIGHLRNGSSGGSGDEIPNPHPFIYETDINSFAFAQNGGPGSTYMPDLADRIISLNSYYGWGDEQLVYLATQDVDSGVYFGYLMAYIRLNNWNILQGLREAMTDDIFQGGWDKNFVFTDGYDAYAYRHTNDELHPLHYGYNQDYNAYTVMTDDSDYADVPFGNDELIFFSPASKPIRFKNFLYDIGIQVCKEMLPPKPDAINYWCWESFPVLNLDDSAIETMTQENGTPYGFDTAIYVEAQADGSYLEKDDDGQWHEFDLPSFTQTAGYKIEVSIYDTTPAWVRGQLITHEDSSFDLQPGQDNWVGYWLLNSQSLRQALGDNFDDVERVDAQTFCYMAPEGRAPDPPIDMATLPLEFGKMYNIILKEGVGVIEDFYWTNSRIPSSTGTLPGSEFFTWNDAPEYEVIDIASVENGAGILEIGVFADEVCVGASVVVEFPVQILAYTEGYEGIELDFQYWYGERTAVQARPSVAVWDGDDGKYYAGSLAGGQIDYRTVRLGGRTQAKPAEARPLAFSASPNPFNPSTTIALSLPQDGMLEVSLYNLRGQCVRALTRGDLAAGDYSFVWNGQDDNGRPVASGIYFCRVTAGDEVMTRKLLLLK
ncbi:MAG: T9SS type A sorting domain-containing protein [Candidatus Cloacimonetes bacterium]|nr:T9SS type A sorting domain-containing protein [Candidatus Cloacimonadota bacterium]